ncbi:MAG: cytochrome c3 family protein [Chlorobium sp.]|nr:cytochrome c3 family protein [Chlorobium sp.]
MKNIIVAIIAGVAFAGVAFAGAASEKERIVIKIENKEVDFNHKGHIRYTKENCDACHLSVPQEEGSGKVNWMFCRGCHDQSLKPGGIKPQPLKLGEIKP